MNEAIPEKSIYWHLMRVPDSRRREGRIYPLGNILNLMKLAAFNGMGNLRQIWLWGVSHWQTISRPLGFSGQAKAPTYGTIWYALKKMDMAAMEQETELWLVEINQSEGEGWSLDGKQLRGRRREELKEMVLAVVTINAQILKQVVGQRTAESCNDVEAAMALLKTVPLNGKLVTVDAGLLHGDLVNTVFEQGTN